MGLLDLFRKKKIELTDEQKKWNKMWDLWMEEKVDSPFAELMTYQSEINNGGHGQYFTNVDNVSDLQKEMADLKTILSKEHCRNLQNAYQAYLVLEEDEDDEKAEEMIEQCDDFFYEHEEEINQILEEYANHLEL